MQSTIENAMNINDDAQRKLQVSRRFFLSLMGMGAITLGLGLAGCGSTEGKGGAATTGSDEGSTVDKITMVWLPNESSAEFDKGREEFGKVLEKYAGVPVELMDHYRLQRRHRGHRSGKRSLPTWAPRASSRLRRER